MSNFVSFLGLAGPASVVFALIVMAQLSQRLGAVTKRARLYLGFYLSVALMIGALFIRLITLFMPDSFGQQAALFYDVPVAAALIIAVVIAWRYWSWLLNERGNNR